MAEAYFEESNCYRDFVSTMELCSYNWYGINNFVNYCNGEHDFLGFDDTFKLLERLSVYVFDLPVDVAINQFQKIDEAF